MMKQYGAQSMVTPLKRVIIRRPDEAFWSANPDKWHYTSQPNQAEALQEHADFVAVLAASGAEVIYHDVPLPEHADAIFVHDPILVCDAGAILLSMGKLLRKEEPAAFEQTLLAAGVPIHYRLTGDALAEGGDCLWVDEKTLAVGQGYRTNAEGLRQLQEALPDVDVVPVHLPYFEGPDACLHLMSIISIVDVDLAVIYKPLFPVPFLQFLEARDFRFVEVPEAEFLTMGPNVLATGPSEVLMLGGNPITQAGLQAAGCEVVTYHGTEISLKAEGGATCLTRPILRS